MPASKVPQTSESSGQQCCASDKVAAIGKQHLVRITEHCHLLGYMTARIKAEDDAQKQAAKEKAQERQQKQQKKKAKLAEKTTHCNNEENNGKIFFVPHVY